MTSADTFPTLDDESYAIQLQLEENEAQRERQTGKWNKDRPPDFTVIFDDFQAELKKALSLVEDLKFAHSIARAVDADGVAIEELKAEEAQSARDREFALRLNGYSVPPPPDINESPEIFRVDTESVDWQHVPRATESSTLSVESSSSTVAGPSGDYPVRQRAGLEHLPQLKVDCSVCGDKFYPHATVRLACSDIYCKECLKSFFLRVAKDESLFPPMCHRQPIDLSTVEADLSVDELKTYRLAEQEFTSTNRVYCAHLDCAKFIPTSQRTADRASCKVCGAETCTQCKAIAHDGFCSADEARQSLVHLGYEQGWQICFGCGEMVVRHEGCNHMT
ncbi:hypothetical protein N7G274_009616 [Stereocaulon virgatum]|uniref:RBR-type E3 ubiquitin transferase n=1 Tax=Stereocaulon virgatum TaxID=373712 RepID=A0ABR3ZY99_9LECA